MWGKFKNIPKLLPLSDVFNMVGYPKFKLGTRPVYYMGQGFLISFSETQFKIENSCRLDFGPEGEYALSLYYFMYKSELELFFRFNEGEYFDFGENILGNCFDVSTDIAINDSLELIEKKLRLKSNFGAGETRNFKGEEFIFQNKFIIWDNYTFFFFGQSKKAKLTAFEFTFSELN